MIYVDSSVLLACLLAEERHPADSFWNGQLISSRLLELEVWTVLQRLGAARSHASNAEALLSRVGMIELIPEVLFRAREPFPVAVRTLDALHLASADFVRGFRRSLRVASYDTRFCDVALAIGFPLADI